MSKPISIPGTSHMVWGAWTIDLGWHPTTPGCHPFAGPYLLERAVRSRPRSWQRGMTVALFKTQTDARETLKRVKKKNPKARVVRVSVSLTWATETA